MKELITPNIKIEKSDLNDKITNILLSLSNDWEKENSCYGYQTNCIDDIKGNDIFLISTNGCVVGYLLCHTYNQENSIAPIPTNSKCLEIEEIYIASGERSKGLGKRLFEYAIDHYKDIDYVTLSTANKNHKAILHFYIDELGLEFWSAKLFKKMR